MLILLVILLTMTSRSGTKKFYAVAKGRKVGIFNNWPETDLYVHKFSGARFQGFKTWAEAKNALDEAGLQPSDYDETSCNDPTSAVSSTEVVSHHKSPSAPPASCSDSHLQMDVFALPNECDEEIFTNDNPDVLLSFETNIPVCLDVPLSCKSDSEISFTINPDTENIYPSSKQSYVTDNLSNYQMYEQSNSLSDETELKQKVHADDFGTSGSVSKTCILDAPKPDYEKLFINTEHELSCIKETLSSLQTNIEQIQNHLDITKNDNKLLTETIKELQRQNSDLNALLRNQNKQIEELIKQQDFSGSVLMGIKQSVSTPELSDEAKMTLDNDNAIDPNLTHKTESSTFLTVEEKVVNLGNSNSNTNVSGRSSPSSIKTDDSIVDEEDIDILSSHTFYRSLSTARKQTLSHTYSFFLPDTCTNVLIGDSNMRNIKKKWLDKSGATEVRTFPGASIKKLRDIIDSSDYAYPFVKKVTLCAGTIDCNRSYIDCQRITSDVTNLLDIAKEIFPNAVISFTAIPPQSNHKINTNIVSVNTAIRKLLANTKYQFLKCEGLWYYVDHRTGQIDRGIIQGQVHFTSRGLSAFLQAVSIFFFPIHKSSLHKNHNESGDLSHTRFSQNPLNNNSRGSSMRKPSLTPLQDKDPVSQEGSIDGNHSARQNLQVGGEVNNKDSISTFFSNQRSHNANTETKTQCHEGLSMHPDIDRRELCEPPFPNSTVFPHVPFHGNINGSNLHTFSHQPNTPMSQIQLQYLRYAQHLHRMNLMPLNFWQPPIPLPQMVPAQFTSQSGISQHQC